MDFGFRLKRGFGLAQNAHYNVERERPRGTTTWNNHRLTLPVMVVFFSESESVSVVNDERVLWAAGIFGLETRWIMTTIRVTVDNCLQNAREL